MSFVDPMAAICLVANAAKGLSALQLARDVGCSPKSAFVLAHKIREALASESKAMQLYGEVGIDGCHVGGVVRPENRTEDRKDRRVSHGSRSAALSVCWPN
jgi:hypothetical protein